MMCPSGATYLPVGYAYKNPTEGVGLVQRGHHHYTLYTIHITNHIDSVSFLTCQALVILMVNKIKLIQ